MPVGKSKFVRAANTVNIGIHIDIGGYELLIHHSILLNKLINCRYTVLCNLLRAKLL